MSTIDFSRLTADERLELLEQLWDSLSSTPDAVPLTNAQREELDRRLDEIDRESDRQKAMDIKPIRNQRDYKAALAEIDRLFDAQPRTPEADLLEVWVTLVEAYEQRNHPIPPPDPIEAILYFMESRGLARRI